MTAHYIDQMLDERDYLEWEIEMLQRALDLAARFGRRPKVDRLEWELSRAMRELHNRIPPETE